MEVRIKVSDRFVVWENLGDSKGISRAWENIKENIKTSAKQSLVLYELKQHKPRFDEEYLRFLDQRKQTKLQDLNHGNVDNPNNIKREASRHFRNKGKNVCKLKLTNLKQTVRSRITETCIGA